MNECGYIKCEVCKGYGSWTGNINGKEISQLCPNCRGVGKITWLENVFGKTTEWGTQYKFDGKDWILTRSDF